MTAPDIRQALPDDAAELTAFAARTFHETFAPVNRAEDMDAYMAEAFVVEATERDLRDPRVAVFLAYVDGALAGYGTLREGPVPASVPGDTAVEIARFYVDRPWHGSPVARSLLAACFAEARRRGHGTIWLGVWERNDRAIAFYSKCGFVPCGSHVFLLGSDVQTDVLMARPLD